jgi:hypothetical protein
MKSKTGDLETMRSRHIIGKKTAIAIIAASALSLIATPAAAADPPTRQVPTSAKSSGPLGDMQPTKTHAGCGAGVSLGWTNADLELPGSPINIGANGARIGGRLLCDWQFQAFIIGAWVDLDKQYGDLNTIGVRTEWSAGGKVGMAVSQSATVYSHAGWYRADGGFGHVDGLGYGVGSTLRLAGSPFELDLRWTHKTYDNVLSSGLDVNADEFKASLIYKLNFFR